MKNESKKMPGMAHIKKIFPIKLNRFPFFRVERLQVRWHARGRQRAADRRPAVSGVRPPLQVPPGLQALRPAHLALPGEQVELEPAARLCKYVYPNDSAQEVKQNDESC